MDKDKDGDCSSSSFLHNDELRKGLERRLVLERRATSVVVEFSDTTKQPITVDKLRKSLLLIDKTRYTDILAERSLVGLCGYPLCNGSVSKKTLFSQQKYKISIREQRVYDIEQRKQFCSDACYRRSGHLLSQISEEPVYLRNLENPEVCRSLTDVKLICDNQTGTKSSDNSGIHVGEVVIDGRDFLATRSNENDADVKLQSQKRVNLARNNDARENSGEQEDWPKSDEEGSDSSSSDDNDDTHSLGEPGDYDHDVIVNNYNLSKSVRQIKLIDPVDVAKN